MLAINVVIVYIDCNVIKMAMGRMRKSEKPANTYHHGDLRSAILQRSAEIISEQGIEKLTLRAIARDLSVSHGAPNRHFKTKADLLVALAADGWRKITEATLDAARAVEDGSAHDKLNAMGRGFLRWAITHQAEFIAITHPDVNRHQADELELAMAPFRQTITDAVAATQEEGRHKDVPLHLLTLYTNSVPYGLGSLLTQNPEYENLTEAELDELIADLIELVVPTRSRPPSRRG